MRLTERPSIRRQETAATRDERKYVTAILNYSTKGLDTMDLAW